MREQTMISFPYPQLTAEDPLTAVLRQRELGVTIVLCGTRSVHPAAAFTGLPSPAVCLLTRGEGDYNH
jgi:hypothetical protein